MNKEIFRISDFRNLTENLLKENSATHELKIGEHKETGKKWLIKTNKINIAINEFASQGIYELMLGKDLVNDIHLIKDNYPSDFLTLAIEYKDNLKLFINEIFQFYDNRIPFQCAVIGNCKQGNFTNYENSIIATTFVDDTDTDYANNYAAIELNPNNFKVTRFDFDDSFAFFNKMQITKCFHRNKVMENKFQSNILPYTNLSLTEIRKKEDFKNLMKHLDPKKLVKAINKLIDIGIDKIKEVIHHKFLILKEVVSDEVIKKVYDINKLNCETVKEQTQLEKIINKTIPNIKCLIDNSSSSHIQNNNSHTYLEKIEKFIYFILERRIHDLKELETCLKVEYSLYNNDLNYLKKNLDNEKINFKTVCTQSLYEPNKIFVILPPIYDNLSKYMIDIIKKDHNIDDLRTSKEIYIEHMIKSYNNDVSKYLLGQAVHDEL